MARRRRSRISPWAIAAVGGALVLLTVAARAESNVIMNPNIYTKGDCSTNPQDADPTDKTPFTYNVDWFYLENDTIITSGRVGRFTVQGSSGGKIPIEPALDPIPKEIQNANPNGINPCIWYTCPNGLFGEGMCKSDERGCIDKTPLKGCCTLGGWGFPTSSIPVKHELRYRVSIDPCLDTCRYDACSPYHDVPKGGGEPMVFKYIRHEASCPTDPQYCEQYTLHAPCGWKEGPYGSYRAKCYIRIQ